MNSPAGEMKSLGGNLWKISSGDERAAELLTQKYNFPFIVARILTLREVQAAEAADFLAPKIQKLMPNPSVLKDMDKDADISALSATMMSTVPRLRRF